MEANAEAWKLFIKGTHNEISNWINNLQMNIKIKDVTSSSGGRGRKDSKTRIIEFIIIKKGDWVYIRTA